jgi:Mrp family chromosome partitioning ATPase
LNPLSPAAELYRLTQAKLSVLQKERGINVILVTSAVPNEGKTFAACCLAGVLARERRKRVLLIDADLRKGSAGRVFGLNENMRGLNQLLENNYLEFNKSSDGSIVLLDTPDLEQHIVKCAELNLSFLPSGTGNGEPAQLSNIPQLELLIRQAAGMFDWVIIDSPPVLAVADTHLLAPLCDATLFVVHSRKTNAAAVKEAIQRIGSDRICGLLMNRMNRRDAYYDYSYYGNYGRKQNA